MTRLAVIGIIGLILFGCASHCEPTTAPMASQAVQVYLVRHARAYRNEPHPADMTAEQLDSLTPHGIAQAKEAGESLVKKHIVAVYASPTHRTMQTGQIIAEKAHAPPAVESAAFGPMTATELPSAGLKRALEGIDQLARRHAGQAIVIVTHGDIAPLLIGEARGTPIEQRMKEDTIEPGKVMHLVWENGRLRMPR